MPTRSPIYIMHGTSPCLFGVGQRLAVAVTTIFVKPGRNRFHGEPIRHEPCLSKSKRVIAPLARELNVKHIEQRLELFVW